MHVTLVDDSAFLIHNKKKKHFGNVIGPLEFPPRKNERKEKGPTQPKIIPQFESHDNYQF